jgi:hypothetical protein
VIETSYPDSDRLKPHPLKRKGIPCVRNKLFNPQPQARQLFNPQPQARQLICGQLSKNGCRKMDNSGTIPSRRSNHL